MAQIYLLLSLINGEHPPKTVSQIPRISQRDTEAIRGEITASSSKLVDRTSTMSSDCLLWPIEISKIVHSISVNLRQTPVRLMGKRITPPKWSSYPAQRSFSLTRERRENIIYLQKESMIISLSLLACKGDAIIRPFAETL